MEARSQKCGARRSPSALLKKTTPLKGVTIHELGYSNST
jgi:hypothetical protein